MIDMSLGITSPALQLSKAQVLAQRGTTDNIINGLVALYTICGSENPTEHVDTVQTLTVPKLEAFVTQDVMRYAKRIEVNCEFTTS